MYTDLPQAKVSADELGEFLELLIVYIQDRITLAQPRTYVSVCTGSQFENKINVATETSRLMRQ